MTKLQQAIINAKKRVFSDFCIPWDESIEPRFLEECAQCPNADPELIMDRLAHDKIIERFDEIYG